MDVIDAAKWFAIGEVLSDWKEGLTADEVLDEVELMTDDVTVWQPFEDYDGAFVRITIENMAEHAQQLINTITGDLKC